MEQIKISIIIPNYNREKYIEKCINSALNQKTNEYEIIVVDDGSTDRSREILERYKTNSLIRVFYNENHGVSYSRNYGVRMSLGKYVMFLDSDDLIVKDSVLKLIKIVNNNPQYNIFRFSGYEEKKNHKLYSIEKAPDDFKDNIFNYLIKTKKPIRTYSWLLLIEKDKFIPFNERLHYLEDTMFYFENIDRTNIRLKIVEEKIYIYKFNEFSITKKKSDYINIVDYLFETYRQLYKIILRKNYNIEQYNTWFLNLILYKIEYFGLEITYKEFIKLINYTLSKPEINNILRTCSVKKIDIIKATEYRLIKRKWIVVFYLLCKIKKVLKARRIK